MYFSWAGVMGASEISGIYWGAALYFGGEYGYGGFCGFSGGLWLKRFNDFLM